ncbi:MAG: SUMF1/EgtB/PvdO family nonheme iron enzyme [Planctomycetes bacterium]|nr:SUMF1/EgtB/PvdO family nonheme iron enzyme [Planctomycetota bacterium]
MDRDAELLVGLLAHHLGFVTAENLVVAAKAGAPVGENLERAGLLLPAESAALRQLATTLIAVHGGDAGRALAAAPVDSDLRKRLVGRVTAGATELRQVNRETDMAPVPPAPSAENRYQLGREIGRGGLGRVVEAIDTRFGREVAVKLVLSELPLELSTRFTREARLTAILEHPNIVPVHDFGSMAAETGELFLCMKRIRGRDLAHVLSALAKGNAAARAEWSRVRLLGAFQGICLGVAYAHSKGVIHRDLKPSNVMIGDFGEVLIVDWGLAKEMGTADAEAGGKRPAAEVAPELTMDGDILGTPAYMSPEQAGGRASDLDARSDIFALGAILYEMLALRPPYTGQSFDDLITSVKSGSFRAPSATALPAAGGVPAELEAIVLKAMAFDRNNRYASAIDLHRDVQLYIEGVKERERAQREAADRAAAGNRELARIRELKGAIEAQTAAVKELEDTIPGYLPAERKRPLWEAEEKLKGLEEERITAHTRATALFEQALMADAECREAVDGRCEMETDAFLEAESARDAAALSLHAHRLQAIDLSGTWRAKLDAPGRLDLRTFAWECDCLKPSPGFRADFDPERLVSWRDGAAVPVGEISKHEFPVAALRTQGTFGHRASCRRRELTGLAVRAARYVERDRRLVATESRSLGVTPVRVELPQGSWRVEIEPPEGFHGPVVAPVKIDRSSEWVQEVNLYPAAQVPDGFIQVPGGPFTFAGKWAGGADARVARTRDLFVSRFATTCEDYLAFLNELLAAGREDMVHKVEPHAADGGYFPREPGNPPRLRWPLPGPEHRGIRGLDPRDPVFSLSWFGAAEYAAWRSAKEGRLYTLLHEEEFEKAARGTDGRIFPWGDHEDLSFHHADDSYEGGSRMAPVGTFAGDESPYGIRDLAGSICSWCWNAPEAPHRVLRALRGGAWEFSVDFCRSTSRLFTRPMHISQRYGVRLAFRPMAWQELPLKIGN